MQKKENQHMRSSPQKEFVFSNFSLMRRVDTRFFITIQIRVLATVRIESSGFYLLK